MITIEKGVPLPKQLPHGGLRLYPVRDLKVGDSFLVPRPHNPKALAQTLYQAAKRAGFKISVVRVGRDVRCWRVS